MRRGEIWTLRDDSYASKARPVVIIQTNIYEFKSVIVCLLTTFDSSVIPTRVKISPTNKNGLQQTSFVMTEKIVTINQELLGSKVGELSANQMQTISTSLIKVLGITN